MPWTVIHQAPLSMGFPRQEYWSGLLFPSPGDLPDLEIKPVSPALASRFLPLNLWEALCRVQGRSSSWVAWWAAIYGAAQSWTWLKRFSSSIHFPGDSNGKETEMQETWVWSLGLEDSLEQGTATHSSILAWRTPWTEEPSRLYTAHSVIKSRTKLRDWHFTSYSYYKQGRETIDKIFPAPPRMGNLPLAQKSFTVGKSKADKN